MQRDSDIQKSFETADDILQGIIGYQMYVAAMQNIVNREEMLTHLPEREYRITFRWVRLYQRQNLISSFEAPKLEFYQGKILLVAVTSAFEAALGDFIQHLHNKRLLQIPPKNAAARIIWAYEQTLQATIGHKDDLKELPIMFGIIDNARRLRNLIAHNNGLFNERYETDAIRQKGMVVELHPFYDQFKKSPKKKVPLVVRWPYLQRIILAHIAVLHILHNQIQKEHFGVLKGYNYAEEGKPIDWEKVLWGGANVRLVRNSYKDSKNVR